MTEPDHQPLGAAIILVDEWPDGTIESQAWVEVTESTPTPESAVAAVEDEFPIGERDEADEEEYVCAGDQVRSCPDPDFDSDLDDEGTPWIDADPENPLHKGARDFWVVKVVCKL